MSKPLDLETQRPYALDQLTQLQSQIMQSAQGMVVQRARIEKYRQSDLAAARDTYTELEQIRRNLTEQITAAQLFLLELEEYKLASMAGQLCRGISGFNLMSTGYKPIYEVLSKFAAAFPTGQKTNAAVVGRLMNNIKLGYYPTDPDNISLMLRAIRFPDGVTTNLFDPCCGCGKALRQLAQGNNCYAYGVELDESRAEEAQTRLHRVGFGSFFYSRISHEAFHLLFLNPPYLSVINESGGRSRHEKRFLIESLPTLMYGGLLIYVIPYDRLRECREQCRELESKLSALNEMASAQTPDFDCEIREAQEAIGKIKRTMTNVISYVSKRAELTFSQLKMNRVEISLYDVVKSTGEVKDTFKFTYSGRRYDRLSLSEKIRAGMEVSELIKRLTGRNYPVFVDNMESVDDLANVRPTGQIIMAKCVSNAPLQVRPIKPIVFAEQRAA